MVHRSRLANIFAENKITIITVLSINWTIYEVIHLLILHHGELQQRECPVALLALRLSSEDISPFCDFLLSIEINSEYCVCLEPLSKLVVLGERNAVGRLGG